MRALVAYLFALLAIGAGVYFGFYAGNDVAGKENGRAAAKTPVILAPVVEAPFADSLAALGTAIANESVDLTANRTDLVKAIHFDDGQTVEAKFLLVELEASEEKAMLAEAEALLVDREAAHGRAVDLKEKGIASDSEVVTALAQLSAARSRVATLKASIADCKVVAPFKGVLGLRRISVGALLNPSTVIATLDDLSKVKVDFTVPETWLSAIRLGQSVKARCDAWPGEVFDGSVSAIDTRLDARTRSATIRAVVANKDMRLRPGMLMKVEVDRGEQPSRLVPEDAIVQTGDTHYVFVVGDDGVASKVDIVVGRRQVGRVEVLDGLAAGQRVVVEGLVRVRDGSTVDVVEIRDEESR